MPFSIIEAMHSGLPIIISDLPSLLELVDSQTGYIVSLDNNAELAKTFIEIAQDFETAYRKGKEAAKKIAAICSYEKMVNAYRELYLSAN
jgi:glycosyltransferase involved in cell wall biosynthesis